MLCKALYAVRHLIATQ